MLISLEEAECLIKGGEVVAVPTDTVFGFAALASDLDAIQRLYDLKQRPPSNPLTIHFANKEDIHSFVDELPTDFDRLTDTFWPGALTLVIPVDTNRVLKEVRAGLSTTGFRVPNHPIVLELLRRTGPLVIPSANLSGKAPATSSIEIEQDFGAEFPILEGPTGKGTASTVIEFNQKQWQVLRQGAIPAHALQ